MRTLENAKKAGKVIVTGQSDAVARWAGERLGCTFVRPFEAVGILNRHGQRIGAAILNDHADRNIELTCYGPGAFSRGVCVWLAQYCFIQNDCLRVTTRTAASNLYVRKLLEHHGWVKEGTLREWYDDEDCILYGLLKRDCRFLSC